MDKKSFSEIIPYPAVLLAIIENYISLTVVSSDEIFSSNANSVLRQTKDLMASINSYLSK